MLSVPIFIFTLEWTAYVTCQHNTELTRLVCNKNKERESDGRNMFLLPHGKRYPQSQVESTRSTKIVIRVTGEWQIRRVARKVVMGNSF